MARKRSTPATQSTKTTPRRTPATVSPATTQRNTTTTKRPSRKAATSHSFPETSPSATAFVIRSPTDAHSILSTAPVEARPASKQAQLIGLLRSPQGADLAQMMAATGWQAHSVRGAISGVLRKKLGLKVVCQSDAAGMRRYHILETADA